MRTAHPPDALSAQGAYYVLGGLWPVVHLRSFVAVTGPKQDTWLVKTFGVFIAAVGLILLAARPEERRTVAPLGVLSALTLAAADVWYVARRRISPTYLADAALELLLAGAVLRQRRH